MTQFLSQFLRAPYSECQISQPANLIYNNLMLRTFKLGVIATKACHLGIDLRKKAGNKLIYSVPNGLLLAECTTWSLVIVYSLIK